MNDFNSFISNNFSSELYDLDQPLIIDDLTYNTFYLHKNLFAVTYIGIFIKYNDSNLSSSNRKSLDFMRNNNRLPVGITRCSYRLPNSTLIQKVTYLPVNIDVCKWEMHP